jgi:hypothetical protein
MKTFFAMFLVAVLLISGAANAAPVQSHGSGRATVASRVAAFGRAAVNRTGMLSRQALRSIPRRVSPLAYASLGGVMFPLGIGIASNSSHMPSYAYGVPLATVGGRYIVRAFERRAEEIRSERSSVP